MIQNCQNGAPTVSGPAWKHSVYYHKWLKMNSQKTQKNKNNNIGKFSISYESFISKLRLRMLDWTTLSFEISSWGTGMVMLNNHIYNPNGFNWTQPERRCKRGAGATHHHTPVGRRRIIPCGKIRCVCGGTSSDGFAHVQADNTRTLLREKGERVDQSEQARNTVKTKMVDYSLTGLSSECLFHAKFQIHCRSSDLQTANSSSLSELLICLSQVKVHSLALLKSQNSHSYNYRRINVLLHSKRN